MKDRHKGAKEPLTTFLWCPAVWISGDGKEKHTLRSNEDFPSSKTDHLGSAILQLASMLSLLSSSPSPGRVHKDNSAPVLLLLL